MWEWLKKARADGHHPDTGAPTESEQGRDSMFRLEALEPRLLLSGDPVLAELARWVADDGSASDAEELSVIIQEIDLASETEIKAGNGPDESANGGQTVAWPAGWATPANNSEISETAKQIRFSESGQVDLLSLVTSLVGQALGNSETAEGASQTSAEGSGQDGSQTGGGLAADSITSEQLNGFIEKAIEVLSTTDSALADRLADISFQVADLADGVIAEIRGNVIYIDVTAAGHGWALDALFEHNKAAAGESHAAVTDAGSGSEDDKQQLTQDVFEEQAASQGQEAATGHEHVVVDAVTVAVNEASDKWQPAATVEHSEKTTEGGQGSGATGETAGHAFAIDQFQTQYTPTPAQGEQGTVGDNGATPGNSPSDLLQQVLDLVGLATGLQGDVEAGDGASDIAIGVVAASHRLQESNRSTRSELRKDNSKTVNSGETASDQGSQATESEVRIIAEGGDDAAPRGPPAIVEIQAIREHDVSDTVQGALVVSSLYDETVLETASSDDEMPRAPPAVADMPRAPPTTADTADYLLIDGVAVTATDTTNTLTSGQLEALFQQALRLWSETTLSSEQLDRLNALTVQIGDLSGGILGEADGLTLYIYRS